MLRDLWEGVSEQLNSLRSEYEVGASVPYAQLITHVLVHEIGHHFGLSDDDIHRIEDEA